MQDKRLTVRLMRYWDLLRKDGVLPQWERVNPGVIEDAWPRCCAWRVEVGRNDTLVYTYEYVGKSVREALGANPTGQMFMSQLRGFPGARIAQRSDEVVKSRTPVTEEGRFINEVTQVVKYRSCLLPFGTKSGKVTHILLGLSWKAY